MDKIEDLAVAVAVAVLTWWLTNLSRKRADREAERSSLQIQADALVVAVADVRGAAASARILYEGWPERARSGLLAALACAGAAARTRVAGGSDRLAFVAGLGAAAHLLGADRRASKQHAATVQGPMLRLATAAAPLVRHPDEGVATAVDNLLAAASRLEDATRLDAALDRFGREVSRALQPGRFRLRLRSRVQEPHGSR
ncbi:hypothetical protein Z951_02875 [Streptomyces sp. PRh5]|uniref:hypothetical protein n=1 Tax=Streptomyces sp. PRh5 TaxID=1158056 RepID=UPI00044D5AD1|nr:hypothetical protein [Streptomyces sp. PRh5]EXU69653.1 hypothetical protein Z951_02875 [Streptomyces sp. PRh5]